MRLNPPKQSQSKLFKNNYKGNIKLDSLFTRDYILELQSTNPDTIVKLKFEFEPNPSATSRRFKRMYACLGGIKKGFRACMMDFLDCKSIGICFGRILRVLG
uniref:Uncharacterized protein n=1 Tax=Lactuca sativa TaxID=4236 RepID=A0A9R1WE26_LACSA|nr:hypothetical protein LSAT_V11C200054670 [Lactuca sativa]